MIRRGRHLITVHEPGANLNDDNPGLYWQLAFLAWGYYRNSHSKPGRPLTSRWAGLAVTIGGFTFSAGLVTGYPGQPLLPYASVSEIWRCGGKRYRIFYIPRTRLNGDALHAAEEARSVW